MMRSWSAPASPACTCCTACAGSGFSARVFEAGERRRRHLVLEPLSRRALRRREPAVLVLVLEANSQQEWNWTERYARSRKSCATRTTSPTASISGRDIRFETRVTAAHFDEAATAGSSTTDRGERVTARSCVMATGCLSAARTPGLPGPRQLHGRRYHTGHWPHEGVDFTGKRVGVIGTGSSAIQAIPVIADAGGAPHRVPAHAELQRPGAQRPARPRDRAQVEGELSGARAGARARRRATAS